MYILIITLGLGIIIGLFTSIGRMNDGPNKGQFYILWENFLSAIICSGMVYGITLLIVALTWAENPKSYRFEYADQEIKSLLNSKEGNIQGSFFLGCGSISGGTSEYYVAYAPTDRGDIRIKVDAYVTYLEENDEISPMIKDYYIRKVRPARKAGWLWAKKERVGEWTVNTYGTKTAIVPTNTVKVYDQYSIN